jgi:hypothetical protein
VAALLALTVYAAQRVTDPHGASRTDWLTTSRAYAPPFAGPWGLVLRRNPLLDD